MTTTRYFRDWQYEVANGDTKLGFAEWFAHQKEATGGGIARDTVIVLPSGTEISVEAATGDLRRSTNAVLEAGLDDLAADLPHVVELLNWLADRAVPDNVRASISAIVEYNMTDERRDFENMASMGDDTEGHVYLELLRVEGWLLGDELHAAIAAGEAETGNVAVSDPAFVAKIEDEAVRPDGPETAFGGLIGQQPY